jgi:2-aminoadipate transaminase
MSTPASAPVRSDLATAAESTLSACLEPWIRHREQSLLRRMVTTVARPGVRSLAGGLPDLALFPSRELGAAIEATLREDGRALQYSPAQQALKEGIVALMRRRGVACATEQVLVTSGAQQGIDIAARALLAPGAAVAVEELTYPGALQATAPLQPRVCAVRADLVGGLDVDHLAWLLRSGQRPAFLYVVPDGHNPLGVSLAAGRRLALVELARRHRLPIVEDDPYGLLAYDGPFAPPLRALDDEQVLYLGSCSKILAPGLRLGWMVGPADVIQRLSTVKEASDLETSGLTQRAVARLLAAEGWLDAHLERLRATYRARRDAMLAALERRFAGRATWSRPGGGMFVWVELARRVAESVDTEVLLRRCLDEGNVAFVPGHAFASTADAEARGRSALRLSFSSLDPQAIDAAVEAIADSLDGLLRSSGSTEN